MANGASITPFFTIWTEPRATIRRIVETEPTRYVIPLAAIGPVIGALGFEWVKAKELGNNGNLSVLWAPWAFVAVQGGSRSSHSVHWWRGSKMDRKPAGRRRERGRTAGRDRVASGNPDRRRDHLAAGLGRAGHAGASFYAGNVAANRFRVSPVRDRRWNDRGSVPLLVLRRWAEVYWRGASILGMARSGRDPDTGAHCFSRVGFCRLRVRSSNTSLIDKIQVHSRDETGAARRSF